MTDIDFLMLSRLIPQNNETVINGKIKNTMDEASISLQKKLINGFEANLGKSITLFNFLPVKAYPYGYKDKFVKQFKFSHNGVAEDINIGFCNIMILKRFLQGRNLYRKIKKWALQGDRTNKVIFVYSLYPEFIKAASIAKKHNDKIKIIAMVPDLPEYSILVNNVSFYSRMYLKWSTNLTNKYLNDIDYFVLLTKYMKGKLNITKTDIVIEGIYSNDIFDNVQIEHNNKEIIIFYAGTLHEKFGIIHLLNAFELIKDNNYKLELCGYGDSVDIIKERAQIDKRICFLGQIPRKEVVKKINEASILINPRRNIEEFTKYSFPSKNLEALSSGIPFVGYKLDGIPDEYDNYINYPLDDSAESLKKIITEIGNCSTDLFKCKAQKAKIFVQQNNNEKNQTKKILNMLNEG